MMIKGKTFLIAHEMKTEREREESSANFGNYVPQESLLVKKKRKNTPVFVCTLHRLLLLRLYTYRPALSVRKYRSSARKYVYSHCTYLFTKVKQSCNFYETSSGTDKQASMFEANNNLMSAFAS